MGTTDERALRDELEQLGAALKTVRQRVEAAEVAERVRAQAEASRLVTLRAQREALAAQLEGMATTRAAQREELRELDAALGRARDSIPASARPNYGSDEPQPDLLRMFTDPTPAYARESSWLGKLFARWLAATGREWK